MDASGGLRLREWRPGDEALLRRAEPGISAASLRSRFFCGTPTLPASYLRYVATAAPERWAGYVALRGGDLVGWAEYGRLPGQRTEADLAVLVLDGWQRRGIATALVTAMLPRAAASGVRLLRADVEPGNTAARAALRRFFDVGGFADGLLRYELVL
jgi:RimJ/RimL family protein N-acetyltransferase